MWRAAQASERENERKKRDIVKSPVNITTNNHASSQSSRYSQSNQWCAHFNDVSMGEKKKEKTTLNSSLSQTEKCTKHIGKLYFITYGEEKTPIDPMNNV